MREKEGIITSLEVIVVVALLGTEEREVDGTGDDGRPSRLDEVTGAEVRRLPPLPYRL